MDIEAKKKLANEAGAHGSPHTDEDRQLFEAYMAGHCWATGEWNEKHQCYDEMFARCMYGVWRARGLYERLVTGEQTLDEL